MKFKHLEAKREIRTDDTIQLSLAYTGNIHSHPKKYNQAFAAVLRAMADSIESIDDAWVDPEIVIWARVKGKLTAQAILSPK